MVLAQLRQPLMQPAKRQAVRRQHQRIRRQRLEPRQRIQIFLHRVGIRLRRGRDHRWRHVRQDLVARDQDFVALAEEQRMLDRMPARGDHPPLALAHRDHVAVADADEFARRPRAQIFRWALRRHDPSGILVRRAVSFHEGGKLLARPFLALMPHLPAAEPFGERHANRAFHLLHKISGETEMIGMRMGDGEVLQGTGAQQPPPQLFPDLKAVVGVEAAVDQRPSGSVVEQPAIDVIGRRRHRQPHPEQFWQHVRQFAKSRRALHREIQIVGHFAPHFQARAQPERHASLRDLARPSTPQRFSLLPCRR